MCGRANLEPGTTQSGARANPVRSPGQPRTEPVGYLVGFNVCLWAYVGQKLLLLMKILVFWRPTLRWPAWPNTQRYVGEGHGSCS